MTGIKKDVFGRPFLCLFFCSLKRRYAGCKDTGLSGKAESICLSAHLQERGSPLSLCILEVGTGAPAVSAGDRQRAAL